MCHAYIAYVYGQKQAPTMSSPARRCIVAILSEYIARFDVQFIKPEFLENAHKYLYFDFFHPRVEENKNDGAPHHPCLYLSRYTPSISFYFFLFIIFYFFRTEGLSLRAPAICLWRSLIAVCYLPTAFSSLEKSDCRFFQVTIPFGLTIT